jgi:ribosomal protein S12 methylthiotransferase accessory factor YcaO
MARQSEVTEWILKNQNALDLQVTKLTWIDQALPGYVDIAVRLRVGTQQTEGRGTDRSEEVALGKAVCEAIERVFCIERGISSTGLAGHLSADHKIFRREEYG